MADSAAGQTSKAAKKNKKRKNKTGASVNSSSSASSDIDFQDILLRLKDQLEEAKANKDHQLAGKLRDQIWVLTDVIRGVKTDLPEEDLEEILKSLPLPTQPQPSETTESGFGAGLSTTDRRMKSLEKKLKQIQELKAKQASGTNLEKNQIEKIKSEEKILEEIQELTDIMNSVL